MPCLFPFLLSVSLGHLLPASPPGGAPEEQGTFIVEPSSAEATIPARYRLEARTIPYRLRSRYVLACSQVEVDTLTFPSLVESVSPANNTVWAEYYRPLGSGRFPAAIVLDITAGNQRVSRTIARHLAQNKVAALFVQMAYYGPRRSPGSRLRLLSPDLGHTLAAIRQTVLDIRCAAAWLAARNEIDRNRLGIVGTSLGSLVGSLTAEMEPRLKRVVILLGGGGLVDAYYDDPRAASLRSVWERLGGTKELLTRLLAPVDPITQASALRSRRVLMIAAKRDGVIPRGATESLCRASGCKEMVWYDCTHYTAVLFFLPAMARTVEHLTRD